MDHAIEIGKDMKLFDNKYVKLQRHQYWHENKDGEHVRTLEYFYKNFQREMETIDPDNKDSYKVEIKADVLAEFWEVQCPILDDI